MNVLVKLIKNILISVWIIIAIAVTICLLSYNEFNVTVINKNTLLVIDNDELEPDLTEGDLVIAKRESDKKIEIGDKVYFYNGNKSNEYLINIGQVTDKEIVTSTETTYEIEGKAVSGSYVIGKADSATIIHNLGYVVGILQSRWGYMFLIILPAVFALVYEIILIAEEVKKTKKEA